MPGRAWLKDPDGNCCSVSCPPVHCGGALLFALGAGSLISLLRCALVDISDG